MSEVPPDSTGESVTLSVVDTMGVLAGYGNYVFGDIGDVSFSVSGDVIILDRMNCLVSIFTPSGEFVTSVGGSGDAPWEFNWDTSFAPMYDGRLIVSDYAGSKLVVFNDTLGYSSFVTGFDRTAPAMLKPLPDGTFIARHTELLQDDDGSLSGENSIRIEVDVDPFYNAITDLSTDHEGRLWVRLGSEQIPTFRVYSHDGEYLFTAACPELQEFGSQIRFQTRWDCGLELFS